MRKTSSHHTFPRFACFDSPEIEKNVGLRLNLVNVYFLMGFRENISFLSNDVPSIKNNSKQVFSPQTAYQFNFTIETDASIKVYSGSGTDNQTTLFWGWYQGIWNNSGDMAIVQDENGLMVDYYRYGYD